MTFGAVGFLFAALAAVIPVILHMISRQRAKDVPFPTLRFLKISVEKTRRRRRIQDVLLMLLRMAVLVLIAVGLARPALTSLASLFGSGAHLAVAIVLDNSGSMGVVDHGQPRFDTAVAAAVQILDELGEGDRVALYLTSGRRYPEEGKIDRTHEKVRQILADCKVTYERADVAAQIEQARRLLARTDAPNKQIFVISDFQAISLQGIERQKEAPPVQSAEQAEQEKKARDIPIIAVDCNRDPKPNVALTNIGLQTIVPVAGVPIYGTAELFNASPVPQQRHVELYVDGVKQSTSPAIDVPPLEKHTYDFQFTFARGGLHQGEVRLVGEDGCSLDDRRVFTMEVDQGIPVAVVKAERHEIHFLDDTFYLDNALAAAGGGIRATSLTADQLATEPLSNYTAIFCVNVPAFSSELVERLHAYVKDGGDLVWVCGDNVVPESYNQMNELASGELLPAPLVDVRVPLPGQGRDSWYVGSLEKEHRALSLLTEPASLYQSILVYKHVQVDAPAEPSARVLARLDDGQPILLQRDVGRGSVSLLGTSMHVGWTNLPLRPIFLPLIARFTFELAGAEQEHFHALAGEPLVVPFVGQIPPQTVEVVPPSGSIIRLDLPRDEANPAQEFRYADTHEIGVYLVRPLGGSGRKQIPFSVNMDPEEASSEKISRDQLQQQLKPAPVIFAENPEDLSSTFKWLREGTSLWELFLAGVLVCLVFETFISNFFSPKKEEEIAGVEPGLRRLARKGRSAA